MATLLSGVSANGKGTGASHSGPATVFAYGTFDGCSINLEVSDDDTNYVKADNVSVSSPARFDAPGSVTITAYGTFYIRAAVANAGSNTSVTVKTTQ